MLFNKLLTAIFKLYDSNNVALTSLVRKGPEPHIIGTIPTFP